MKEDNLKQQLLYNSFYTTGHRFICRPTAVFRWRLNNAELIGNLFQKMLGESDD